MTIETHSSFELEGARYRATTKGYFYRDGLRISAEEFRAAKRARFSRIAATIAADIEQEEESMTASNRNEIEVEGVRWARDFAEGKYYRDGEECSRAEFEEAVGVRRPRGGEKAPKRPRRSRDVALEVPMPDGRALTVTARQRAFLEAMRDDPHGSPENGWWTDMLIESAGIPPMSAGAMVSTLREKGLITVSTETRDDGDGKRRRAKSLMLTDDGRVVYDAL